ncbi:MAG: cytochrome d ubiquinol oxidase subunit II [Oligoflexia bacterium]|nr:cytochrome d ubiquinol oxidase subunit II [Oligoflexia bacterium]
MSWTRLAIELFLAASLVFYVLFAGADFGAGILELFRGSRRSDEQQRLVSHAMAPVWEANHVWLVLAVVILFMGFPVIYTTASTYLFLPLVAILVGVVARGTAFTFRHYDTLTRRYYRAYSGVFAWSSLWTAFFLGTVPAALMLGRIDPSASGFSALFLDSWLNPFGAVMGVFTCCLFSFLASLYLSGETRDEELRAIFRRRAAFACGAMVLAGGGVFVTAELSGLPLLGEFFAHPLSVACFIVATALLVPFWFNLRRRGNVTIERVLAAAIVALVLLGWFAVQYPVAIRMAEPITFERAAAPEATLRALLGALVVGILLILPALLYLLKVFKWETLEREG